MHHDRFEYSPIVDRAPWPLPDGARVAVWVIVNVEHFHFDRPATALVPITQGLTPDVLNHSWREYGARVGIWRLMEILGRLGIRATAALNAEACEHYPQIIEAGNRLGWEWMAHGLTNSALHTGLGEDEERARIESAIATIERGTGSRPRGWLSPALTETLQTLDLLAEAGIDYVGDWVNDDQPYRLRVRDAARRLYAVPYDVEINDIPAFLCLHATPRHFAEMIVDQLETLLEDGARGSRVMAISLHPFIAGQPFRARHIARALAHVAAQEGVWLATGAEIVDSYAAAHPPA